MKKYLWMIALVLLSASASWAAEEVSITADGLILNGYDAVAYFTEGQAVLGNPRFTARHDGATYRFSSGANRDAFLANPDRFEPAYGGFCAYGTSLGKKFPVDGEAFEIVDDVLYVNKNLKVYKTWSKDVPGNIAKADKRWPSIREIPAADL